MIDYENQAGVRGDSSFIKSLTCCTYLPEMGTVLSYLMLAAVLLHGLIGSFSRTARLIFVSVASKNDLALVQEIKLYDR